jgi:hypothetical protein
VRLPAPRQLIHQPPRAAVEVGVIHGRRRVMGSSAKKRQTFSKMSRDRELKEKREAKRQKKGDKKADRKAAAEANGATDQASNDATPSADDSE